MTTDEIAKKLVEYCRVGAYDKVYEELFSEQIESIEPSFVPNHHVKGMDNIREKGKLWNEMVEEFHSGSVGDPIVAGNFIAVTMGYDVTFKDRGRVQDEEICVYEVKNGKIIKEQFFYHLND